MPEAGPFHTELAELPPAVATKIVRVPSGQSFDLRVHPVAKTVGEDTFAMLSYNGSIPGPTLRVKQGSEIRVNVTNDTRMETTVHWHGLRLRNAYDGVPHETQAPIPPGGTYTHSLTFPDAGLFWYHPHMREDYAQELGLYGNVLVDPVDEGYWPTADHEVLLTLDDLLIEDGQISPFDAHHANFAAMGRFGNVLLVGGEAEQHLEAAVGEVVRLHLTNTANTRVFKVALPGARMKLIGGDAGRYERERWIDDVVIAPSERALVDVVFDAPGSFTLEHVTPQRRYRLATISVAERGEEAPASSAFETLRVDDEMTARRADLGPDLERPPDKTLSLVAEMDFGEPTEGAATVYVCPMHPEVVSPEPGSCPKCGMKLMPQAAPPVGYTCPMHPEVVSAEPGSCPKCGMKLMPQAAPAGGSTGHSHSGGHHDHGDAMADGIEWEDMMFDVNRTTTSANTRWKLVDAETGVANADIDWAFESGSQVKIRLVNEMRSDHPMHHPFHVHGQRFLVLARDGTVEENLVWKDTVLVRTGQTVDILMDASNPGLWMAHCHIAEHMESGMMFSFRVTSPSR